MCYDKQVQLPELKCQECGRNLSCLIQYVSQASTDTYHRVIYVLVCNQKHYKKSIRVLTYNKHVIIPEKDTSSAPREEWLEDTETDLLNMVSNMKTVIAPVA